MNIQTYMAINMALTYFDEIKEIDDMFLFEIWQKKNRLKDFATRDQENINIDTTLKLSLLNDIDFGISKYLESYKTLVGEFIKYANDEGKSTLTSDFKSGVGELLLKIPCDQKNYFLNCFRGIVKSDIDPFAIKYAMRNHARGLASLYADGGYYLGGQGAYEKKYQQIIMWQINLILYLLRLEGE